MSITSKIYPAKQLITIIARGKISSSEIVETIESFNKKKSDHKVLWDFRYADLDAIIFLNDLENIATGFFKTNGHPQKIGKTAIVASTDLWFGIAKVYAKFEEIKKLSHIVQVFRFMDEATEWLDSDK